MPTDLKKRSRGAASKLATITGMSTTRFGSLMVSYTRSTISFTLQSSSIKALLYTVPNFAEVAASRFVPAKPWSGARRH